MTGRPITTGGHKNNRARGDYFERQVMATMAAHGWVVVRSAGSRGPYDLVALRADKTPKLIQCKLSGRIDPKERTALLDAADIAGAQAAVAWRPRGGRVQLATVLRSSRHLVPQEMLRVPAKPRGLAESHG